jgi:hypothetical protein
MIHQNDIGTVFELTITDQDAAVVDISSAGTRQIVFKRPDGSVFTKTATLVNTGTDGKMKYVTLAGDLDQPGRWEAQGVVAIGSGSWSSGTIQFTVATNLAP